MLQYDGMALRRIALSNEDHGDEGRHVVLTILFKDDADTQSMLVKSNLTTGERCRFQRSKP